LFVDSLTFSSNGHQPQLFHLTRNLCKWLLNCLRRQMSQLPNLKLLYSPWTTQIPKLEAASSSETSVWFLNQHCCENHISHLCISIVVAIVFLNCLSLSMFFVHFLGVCLFCLTLFAYPSDIHSFEHSISVVVVCINPFYVPVNIQHMSASCQCYWMNTFNCQCVCVCAPSKLPGS